LIQYYNQHKYTKDNLSIPKTIELLNTTAELKYSVNYNLKSKNYYQQKVENFNFDELYNFVDYYGPDIFVFWKAALLRKRIMLENMPPMETACKFGKYPT
jgi:hypothetical protein